MWHRMLGLAGAVGVLLAATSTPVSDGLSPGEEMTVSRAVEVLADPARPGTDVPVPADFVETMGYAPAVEPATEGTTVMARPDGSCSSPLGGTAYGFDQACRAHDLGYDLLRYAAETGRPLGPSARRSLDAAFGDRMRAVCVGELRGSDLVGCLAAAASYEAVVVINSWRQAFGTPAEEPLWAVVAPFAPVVMLLVSAARRRLSRRNRQGRGT